jgi:hypothetical protein
MIYKCYYPFHVYSFKDLSKDPFYKTGVVRTLLYKLFSAASDSQRQGKEKKHQTENVGTKPCVLQRGVILI